MNKMMMIVPVVLVLAVVGLGFAGIINIPGITPKKALKVAAQGYTDKDDKASASKTTAPPAAPPVSADKQASAKKLAEAPLKVVKKDPEQGADALAAIWNTLKTPDLLKIASNWKDEDLVRVLTHMDGDQVGKFLTLLASGDKESKIKENPARASKLSKILQDQESVVKEES